MEQRRMGSRRQDRGQSPGRRRIGELIVGLVLFLEISYHNFIGKKNHARETSLRRHCQTSAGFLPTCLSVCVSLSKDGWACATGSVCETLLDISQLKPILCQEKKKRPAILKWKISFFKKNRQCILYALKY